MNTTNGLSASIIETALHRTITEHTPTEQAKGVEVITPPIDIVIDLNQKESSGDE
ncbi:hypothetical protein [Enemella sp. A6]|uniref:hypothetical protein n=1 Tax=Enemella sp. A6 TaxID=3440152 RepID=UPI003EB7C2C7